MATPPTPPLLHYRPDIDGLRAVAVAAVLVYHGFPGRLAGGFLGVDVFFVISGFLITGLIVKRQQEGRFTLGDFYARRIRRIFPALALVLVCALLAGAVLLVPAEYVELGRQSASAAAFVPNLYFWSEVDYFAAPPDASFLIHLWSLGIEEQFYLVWPLILLACLRSRLSPALVVGLVTVASFAFCLYLTATDRTAAFYSPLSRGWELGGGAMLALLGPEVRNGALRNALSLAGAAAIVSAMLFIGDESDFPGWIALVPVAGTIMVIAAGAEAWANRLLALRPLVALGLVSYPLYLWHWPLLSFAFVLNGYAAPSGAARAGLLLLSLALAFATFVLIERPLRRRSALVLVAAMAAVALAAFAVIAAHGFPGRSADPRRAFLAHYRQLRLEGLAVDYREECGFARWRGLRPVAAIPAACTRPGTTATYFLWGDSHAQALSLGLRRRLPEGVALAQVATPGCPPSPDADPGRSFRGNARHEATCRRANRFAMREIARLRPQIVFLAQREGQERRDWAAFAARLHALGAGRVVLVGPVPRWHPSLPQVIVARHWPFRGGNIASGLDRSVLLLDRRLARRYAASADLTYVSPIAALCGPQGCRADAGGELIAVDDSHLSPSGSILVAGEILKSLQRP